jgi:diadenosine tetraphosphatase ApaH/serine/threonine PP2A family protein phosphatase
MDGISVRIALFADIHANREALEACMAHAEANRPDRLAFLGDLVGYGADPGWVVDVVRERLAEGAIVVQGNHDACIKGPVSERVASDAKTAIEWTQSRLSVEQASFLAGLPLQATLEDILFVHANAWNPAGWGYIHGKAEAQKSLMATSCWITFCGHVHPPALYYLGAGGGTGRFSPVAGTSIPLSRSQRWLGIAGSVGQPRDENPAACYAIFDLAKRTLTYHRVAYDHEAAANKVLAAGLPASLAHRLRYGK